MMTHGLANFKFARSLLELSTAKYIYGEQNFGC